MDPTTHYDPSGKRLGVQPATTTTTTIPTSGNDSPSSSSTNPETASVSSGTNRNNNNNLAHHSLPEYPDTMMDDTERRRKSRRKLRKYKRDILRQSVGPSEYGAAVEGLRQATASRRRLSAVGSSGGSGGGSDSESVMSYGVQSVVTAPVVPATAKTAARRAINRRGSYEPRPSGGGSLEPGWDRRAAMSRRMQSVRDVRVRNQGYGWSVEEGLTEGRVASGGSSVGPGMETRPSDRRRGRALLRDLAGAKSRRQSSGVYQTLSSQSEDGGVSGVQDHLTPERLAMLKDLMENEDMMLDEEKEKSTMKKSEALAVADSIADKYLFNSDDEDEMELPDPHEEELKELRRIATNVIAVCVTVVFTVASIIMIGGWVPFSSLRKPKPEVEVHHDVGRAFGKEELTQFLLPMSPRVNVLGSPQNLALEWLLEQNVALGVGYKTKDLFVLASLYYSTEGAKWSSDNSWLTNFDFCGWEGVICQGQNSSDIINLELPDFGLSGTIPRELGHLSDLATLDLSENKLSGTIPPSLFKLSRIETINLKKNRLRGRIPRGIGALQSLQVINLSENNLNGHVPNGLGNLRYLTTLDLSLNSFKGQIPLELANLIHLETLNLDDNDLDGTIPDDIGNMVSLRQFSISQNDLFGGIPSSIGDLPKLQYFRASQNDLTDELPVQVKNLVSLLEFDVSENKFTGSFPSLQDALLLEHLRLHGNTFQGAIPDWLETHTSLQELTLQQNGFNGHIDDTICEIRIEKLTSDCGGDNPKVTCECCTKCFTP